MPTSFSDCGIDAQQAAQEIRDRFIDRSTILGEHRDIFPEDVYKKLLAAVSNLENWYNKCIESTLQNC